MAGPSWKSALARAKRYMTNAIPSSNGIMTANFAEWYRGNIKKAYRQTFL
jgi:hypothetical protein